jgi:hypothetical protein
MEISYLVCSYSFKQIKEAKKLIDEQEIYYKSLL